jgi:hypothetical protein
MRYPFIFLFASALFYAVVIGVIDEFSKFNHGSLFLCPILGIQSFAKYGSGKKYGIYVVLISLISLSAPYLIKFLPEIIAAYSSGKTKNWAWDITDFVSFLPYLFCSLVLGFFLSQGFLIKKIFNSAS